MEQINSRCTAQRHSAGSLSWSPAFPRAVSYGAAPRIAGFPKTLCGFRHALASRFELGILKINKNFEKSKF
jgi:hypothetical protein